MEKIKYTVEEYNQIAKDHYEIAKKLRAGKIKLICSGCGCELEEQRHVNDQQHPFERQMICLDSACGKVFYRIE